MNILINDLLDQLTDDEVVTLTTQEYMNLLELVDDDDDSHRWEYVDTQWLKYGVHDEDDEGYAFEENELHG